MSGAIELLRSAGDNPLRTTAIARYRRCGRSWYYRYRCGISEPTSPYAATGTACHKAIAGTWAPDSMAHSADEVVFESLACDESVDWTEQSPTQCFDKAMRMLKAYEKSGLRASIQPKYLEKAFEVHLDAGVVSGKWDCVTEGHEVLDWKTSSRLRRNELQLQNDFQMNWYAAGYTMCEGTPATKIIWHEITERTAKCHECEPNAAQAFEDLQAAIRGIELGIFMRARYDDYLCSPRWCPHWDVCHAPKWYDPLNVGLPEPGRKT